MAKRKAAGRTGRKTGGSAARSRTRTTGKAKKSAASRRRTPAAKKTSRTGAARKGARKRVSASAARKSSARRPSSAKRTTRTAAGASRKTAGRKSAARRSAPKKATARKMPPKTVIARKAPSLERERRTVSDEDIVQSTPPSSLDLDRSASAVRSGRRGMRERFDQHTETSPALTAGDVDADWESAYSVGDEAPGGDNPTPDQDIVDDIGRAIGVQYEDNEELKADEKIAERDRKRWELDPASAEDYKDHES